MNNLEFVGQLRRIGRDEFNFHLNHLDDDWLGSYLDSPYSELGKMCEVWDEDNNVAVKGFYVGRCRGGNSHVMFLNENEEVFTAHIAFAYICQPEISAVDALKYHAEKQS